MCLLYKAEEKYTKIMKRDFKQLVIKPVAYIKTDFPGKFGIPRQAGIVSELEGKIIFEKEYQKDGILRGMEEFSHLILIWGFSCLEEDKWSSMIRPPKLGGNEKVGVFASRSPNRPNPLGFSVVKIKEIKTEKGLGPVIYVTGVDMVSNTPIYDIKPYLSYSDSFPDAKLGYATKPEAINLEVEIPDNFLNLIDEKDLNILKKILSQDPRPGYKRDEQFSFEYGKYHIQFYVEDNIVKVIDLKVIDK